jgi:hypothetical protein
MAKRHHYHRNGGMFTGLRRAIKTGAGAAVGLTGFAIAASPLIVTALSAPPSQNPGTTVTQIATTYGINPQNPSASNIQQLITTIALPIVGGLIFIAGMRAIVKRI